MSLPWILLKAIDLFCLVTNHDEAISKIVTYKPTQI